MKTMESMVSLTFKKSRTIRIKCYLYTPDSSERRAVTLIFDTGADKTTITRSTLTRFGYKDFKPSGVEKRTALGDFEPYVCKVSRLLIGGQFNLSEITVDAMEAKSSLNFDGVIGMDFISCVETHISGKKGTVTITA